MAANIKGIIVEIGGDTSGLQNALKKVNSSTSSLSKELRGINSLLKFDPKNTELLSQKQTVLNEKIESTEEKLKVLKEAQEEADKAMKNGTKISAENYRNLQREIINTENQLKQMKVEASKWTSSGAYLKELGAEVDGIGNKIGKFGSNVTKIATTTTTAVATIAITSMDAVDEGLDTVAKKTGATGDAAKELQEVYKQVAAEVPAEFGDIGAAVGELNTRLGFTGEKLKQASIQFLKFAKVNDVDVNTSVQLVTRAMGDAGIEADNYAEVLDMLTVAGQKSGISIDSLATNLAKYGAPMRALGIDTKNAIAMFAGWEKAGVNTEIAFSGMKKAISNWGAAGKDATKEFSKTLEEIKKCPDIATATTKAIEVFGAKAGPDLADAIRGGRFEFEEYIKALENGSGTLDNTYGQIVDEVDDAQLAMQNIQLAFHDTGEVIMKTLSPTILDLAEDFKGLMKRFDQLDPELKKNIVKWTTLSLTLGPLIKTGGSLVSLTGKGISALGNLASTVGKVKSGMSVANNATGLLAKGIAGLTTPAGLAATAIAASVAIIIAAIESAEKNTKEAFSNMGESASDFVSGIDSAKSYLDSFNTTLFTSNEEQQQLQNQMAEIQEGITSICKTASDERRNYTQQEIQQLDEYFQKLRELKNKEIAIQENIGTAIKQQAVTQAENLDVSLEEYKIYSQEWINTAKQQRDSTVKLIEEGTTQQIALLNQRYATEESRRSEEYLKEYEAIMQQKEQKVSLANQEVAEVAQAYANGYAQRATQNEGFLTAMKDYNARAEEENNRHNQKLQEIENGNFNVFLGRTKDTTAEYEKHNSNMKKIWDDMYSNMTEEQEKELGVWLAQVAQTEMYGGEISDETRKTVDFILDSYDSMSPKTQEAMKNAMSPMLTEMQKSEPTLYAKAEGIANGILSRLKKSFDIHSPSKKMKKIFEMVMEGGKIGLEDNEKKLYKEADNISNNLLNKFKSIQPKINMGAIKEKVISNTQTVFTTPQIVFNVQELDQQKLEQCFNYINKKFGSRY